MPGPGLENRAPGLPADGLTDECSSFFFFFLPRQGTAEADPFHAAGFWPDDVWPVGATEYALCSRVSHVPLFIDLLIQRGRKVPQTPLQALLQPYPGGEDQGPPASLKAGRKLGAA